MTDLDRCDREIAACQACVADETNPLSERVGAMLGEFDWKMEKELIGGYVYLSDPVMRAQK